MCLQPSLFRPRSLPRRAALWLYEKTGNIITFSVSDIDTSEKVNLRYNLDTGAFEYDADPRDFDH